MKNTLVLSVCLLACMTFTSNAWARGGGRGGSHSSPFSTRARSSVRSHTAPAYSDTRGSSLSSGSRSSSVPSHSGSRSLYRSPTFRSAPSYPSGTHYKLGQSYETTGLPKVERSQSARQGFLRQRGYDRVPSGYQVDHIVPLFKGGSDTPGNMQLLPTQQHQAKTASERK